MKKWSRNWKKPKQKKDCSGEKRHIVSGHSHDNIFDRSEGIIVLKAYSASIEKAYAFSHRIKAVK